jgi:alanine-synthesizing transaminase
VWFFKTLTNNQTISTIRFYHEKIVELLRDQHDLDLVSVETFKSYLYRYAKVNPAMSKNTVTPHSAQSSREIKKSSKLEHVCYDIRGPVLRAANEMEEQGHKIIKLNIGNPAPFGFEAPQEIINDVALNLPNAIGYTDSKGIFPARKAICQYYQQKGVFDMHVNDVYVGNGVSELIVMAMQGLLMMAMKCSFLCLTIHYGRQQSICLVVKLFIINVMKKTIGILILRIWKAKSQQIRVVL